MDTTFIERMVSGELTTNHRGRDVALDDSERYGKDLDEVQGLLFALSVKGYDFGLLKVVWSLYDKEVQDEAIKIAKGTTKKLIERLLNED